MGGAASGAIDPGFGAAGNIVGSYFSAQSAKKAALAKKNAISMLKQHDIAGVNAEAQKYDRESYLGRLGLLDKIDPASRKMYDASSKTYSDALDDRSGDRAAAQDAADRNFAEVFQQNANDAASQSAAAEQAAQYAALGGNLSGGTNALLAGSGVGIGTGAGLGGLSPLQQLQLQKSQQGMSANLANTSQGMADARANLLTNAASLNRGQRTFASNLASKGNQFVGTRMPASFGLSGGDASDLEIQNTNLRNAQRTAMAEAHAEGIAGKNAATNQLIGGLTGGASLGASSAITANYS